MGTGHAVGDPKGAATCRPSAELVCNRTFDKFSCWPDTPPNSTASVPCPWFLPWYQKGNGLGGVSVYECV